MLRGTRCTEVIRISRMVTGRDKVLMFEGKYHGHFDEALVETDEQGTLVPEEGGLPSDVTRNTVLLLPEDGRRVLRIWLANRGVWEAIVGAGPVVPVPGTAEDVDTYVTAFSDCLAALSKLQT